jgi:NADPH:quinone reductase-like Zn-dependent oxidoreductase
MRYNIPEKMKAVQIEKETGKLVVREIPVPKPGKGEVLVKVAAAPINPSDINQIKGILEGGDVTSFTPGIEGSGRVVSAGNGFLPSLFMGKRVGFSSGYGNGGTYAEYSLTKATLCFPIPKAVTDEQGSMLLVNPMTALAFFDIARKGKHKAIINTAAAGALGRMIEFLGNKYGVLVINIVRKDEQLTQLKKTGSKFVLNSSDENFPEQIKILALELHASLAFDAVGGKGTSVLINALPYGGTHIIYGTLSDENPQISSRLLIGENKTISGFYLVNWSKDNGLFKTIWNVIRVRKLLKNDIKIKIQARFQLNKAQEAVDAYLGNMTAGKVLMIP